MTIKQRIAQLENETNFERMTKEDFVSYMENLRDGCFTFGTITVKNEPQMNKRGNPFYGRVTKLSKWGFGTNSDYTTRVNNRREKNGLEKDFKAGSTYITPLNGEYKCAIGVKKDNNQLYVRLYPNKMYFFTEYYIDGVKATEFEMEQLSTFLIEKSKGSKAQGLEEEERIIICNCKVENVVHLVADKRKIKVV